MIVVPITKRIENIKSIQDCLISQMKVNYRENGEKKAFPTNPMLQYCASQCEDDCNAENKKNGDYYEYRSLSHLTDEL